ncbi:MAG TPA: methyl-accepting chemotaxis protein, partial [Treponema sp.]|nr:methyl-accepting chemotaxis protein [Treponema sp.]
MKIKFKLSILMIAILVVIVAGISFMLLQQASSISLELSRESIAYQASQQAEYWKGREDGYVRVLRTLANVMADYEDIEPELRRNRFDSLLQGTLEGEPLIVSLYTVWRKNGVDGMDSAWIGREGSTATGQYAISYSKNGSVITGETMSQADIDTAIANMDGPTARIDMAFDPVPARVNGQNTYTFKIAVPVINPETGQTVARLGCFISIAAVQEGVTEIIKNYEDIAAFAVFTNSGFTLGHLVPERVGKQLRDVETIFGDNTDAAARAVETGVEFACSSYSPVLGSNVEIALVPLQIGNSTKTWTVMVAVSEATVLAPVRTMTRFAIIIAVGAALIAAIIVFVILHRITKPLVDVTETLKDISEGEGDLTRSIDINSKDEIGDLARYFNNTLDKIKHMIIVIKEKSATLSKIGGDLATNMTETASAINEITANIQSIKSRVMNQSASVTQTNATMEQI